MRCKFRPDEDWAEVTRSILLRTSSSAGHGFGTALDEQVDEGIDVFSFLFDQLGMELTGAGTK